MLHATGSQSAARRPRSKRALAAGFLHHTGLEALTRRVPVWRGAIVLSYHRIGDPFMWAGHRGLWSTGPEEFDAQLRLLQRWFDLIAPDQLTPEDLARPGRRVIVSFDDGYRDLYEVAYPVLQARGVRATCFVCSGFVDGEASAWWDEIAWMARQSVGAQLPPGNWSPTPLPLEGPAVEGTIDRLVRAFWELDPGDGREFLERLAQATGAGRRPPGSEDWMTWSMARTMAASGHHIGAHTQTHPVLARLSPDHQFREIAGSLDRIESELGERPRWLAYPVGTRSAFTSATMDAARKAGVELAFSNYGGYVTRGSFTPYDVRRVPSETLRVRPVFAAAMGLPQLLARPPR
ncbi:MAG TPA: polysaccharide deacetylase family protein [Solirubrobacteraceae bacterium]|jgi:peptidoglycan/xylan/chitin deacetylase (PgdA/CDA1 family)|nr:polysaccharide deacetylase family protein [Solirubrobacteraceae bacterium]